jgi:hypothetical protein
LVLRCDNGYWVAFDPIFNLSEDKSVPSGNWEASQLQAVVFLRKAVSPGEIFSAITGEAPESQEDRPKEGVRTQTGLFLHGSLQIVLNPIRIDIVLSPVLGPEILLGGSSQTLGDFTTTLEDFASAIRKWLPDCMLPASRLALVAKALAPADSIIAAYQILKDNLTSVVVEPGKMRDLMFRVNWHAASAHTSERYLNRLTTWAAITAKTKAGVAGSLPTVDIDERHYAYREIDVNTPAEHSDELPSDQLVPIFDEILEVVLLTARGGEK